MPYSCLSCHLQHGFEDVPPLLKPALHAMHKNESTKHKKSHLEGGF